MKVVVLATESETTWMMVNALCRDHPGLVVALERPISRGMLLRRRAARLGWWSVFGQALFLVYLQLLRAQAAETNRALVREAGFCTTRPAGVGMVEFGSVNSAECIGWLAKEDPDAIVVNGTRILSRELLGACRGVFLNTHCGITPMYRGVHGGYWALYQGDRANAGVTVHRVDPGIDTGDVVYQAPIRADERDCFVTYPIRQYVAAIPLMRKALADLAEGRLKSVSTQGLPSAVWYHPTLWQYVAGRWFRGVR